MQRNSKTLMKSALLVMREMTIPVGIVRSEVTEKLETIVSQRAINVDTDRTQLDVLPFADGTVDPVLGLFAARGCRSGSASRMVDMVSGFREANCNVHGLILIQEINHSR